MCLEFLSAETGTVLNPLGICRTSGKVYRGASVAVACTGEGYLRDAYR
jgi:hypothetical protein